MFRQVEIHQDQRDYQRIIWRENPISPILHYRLNTITYGTVCATFLASRTLHQIADDLPSDFSDIKHIIKSDFYVDDLLSGSASVCKAKYLQQRIAEGLSSGGFRLRKWVSNSQELLESIPKEEQETLVEFGNGEIFVKTLGLVWMTHSDCFTFKTKEIDDCGPTTKRKFLFITSRVFDPLGFLSPCTVVTKILFQKLWLRKLDWDDPLPEKMEQEWEELRSNFTSFEKIQIPRFLNIPPSPIKLELHGFADASEDAYAAVVYLRAVEINGSHSVRIVAAKTKVSPLKQVCLPRLELCAAVLLVKLLSTLEHSLDISNVQTFGWTDSTIVLAWLSDVPRRWKTFIANRTSFILERLPRLKWSHVSSKENPADVASRGISPDQLVNNLLWWEGPNFLRESSEHWPKLVDDQLSNVKYEDLEAKRSFIYTATTHLVSTDYTVVANLFERSSSFLSVIRILAQCYRFFDKFKTKQPSFYLTGSQIKRATMFAVRWSQNESFQEDIIRIAKGSDLRGTSKLRSLAPFIDDQGTLRVGGRIGLTTCVSYDTKHPAVLDAHHPFTGTLVKFLHMRDLHPTQQQLLAIIRQSYFIVGAKNLVKEVARSCVTCSRHRLSTSQQQMGNLPSFRITPSRPFSTVGVDFAGPVKVKSKTGRGAKINKGYIAVFVCLVVKAVHIELVSDLTTEAFLACLRRFVSRRGLPAQIYSDNGSNFVGARRKISKLYEVCAQVSEKELQAFLSNKQIDWHFIPPSSSHFGGIWEAGVKSIKRHLTRTIGESPLTFEEYSTLLCQVECLLNSRPIAPMDTTFSENCEILTPGHFLMGCSPIMLPDVATNEPKSYTNRWRLLQNMIKGFWKLWKSDYLTMLQQRPKWRTKRANLKKDDIVIVRDDNMPPESWPLGRIVEVHPGADGLVRSVTVKTHLTNIRLTQLTPQWPGVCSD